MFGKLTLFVYNRDLPLLSVARLAMALLFFPLLFVGWKWALDEWKGWESATLVVLFLAFEPIFLANMPLVHTDAAQTLLLLAVTYVFVTTMRQGSVQGFVLFSILFACLVLVKNSGWLALLWLAPIGLIRLFDSTPWPFTLAPLAYKRELTTVNQRVMLFVAVIFMTAFVWWIALWASYDFTYDYRLVNQPPALSPVAEDSGLQAQIRSLIQRYHPLPRAYMMGLLQNAANHQRPVYFRGKVYPTGTYAYFPWMLLTKSSPILLVLSIWGLILIVRRLMSFRGVEYGLLGLLLPPFVWFLVAVWSRFNLGHRYIMPIYPFLALWSGAVVGIGLKRSFRARRLLVASTGVLLVVSASVQGPFFLSYFNFLAPRPTYEYVGDSSLDWGQGLIALRNYQQQNNIQNLKLIYFGTADPSAYGVDATIISPSDLETSGDGLVAVSATLWQANPTIRHVLGEKPRKVVADSILIYRLRGKHSGN